MEYKIETPAPNRYPEVTCQRWDDLAEAATALWHARMENPKVTFNIFDNDGFIVPTRDMAIALGF